MRADVARGDVDGLRRRRVERAAPARSRRGKSHDTAIRTARAAARIDVLAVMVEVPPCAQRPLPSVLTPKRTVLMAPCLCAVFAALGRRRLRVEKAAQRKRKRADLTRQRQRLGLLLRQFERRGLADHDLLAVLFVDGLIDREHPHVAQNRVADEFLDAGRLFRRFVAPRQQDVDAVVRQDEAAGAGLRRNVDRGRAHALRQHRGHEARALGHHDLGLADRIAGQHRDPHDRADEVVDGVRPVGLFDEARIGGVRRPGLPADILAAITWPRSRSDLATSTSTVSSGGATGAGGGGGGALPPAAKYAAMPPAATATPRTTRRAAFITLHFPRDATAEAAVITGFQQLNVKAWLMRRIQIALILR